MRVVIRTSLLEKLVVKGCSDGLPPRPEIETHFADQLHAEVPLLLFGKMTVQKRVVHLLMTMDPVQQFL